VLAASSGRFANGYPPGLIDERRWRTRLRQASYSVWGLREKYADFCARQAGRTLLVDARRVETASVRGIKAPRPNAASAWHLGLTWIDGDREHYLLVPFDAVRATQGDPVVPGTLMAVAFTRERLAEWQSFVWGTASVATTIPSNPPPPPTPTIQLAVRGVPRPILLVPSLLRKKPRFHKTTVILSEPMARVALMLVANERKRRQSRSFNFTRLIEELLAYVAGLDCRGSPYLTPELEAEQKWCGVDLPWYREKSGGLGLGFGLGQ